MEIVGAGMPAGVLARKLRALGLERALREPARLVKSDGRPAPAGVRLPEPSRQNGLRAGEALHPVPLGELAGAQWRAERLAPSSWTTSRQGPRTSHAVRAAGAAAPRTVRAEPLVLVLPMLVYSALRDRFEGAWSVVAVLGPPGTSIGDPEAA